MQIVTRTTIHPRKYESRTKMGVISKLQATYRNSCYGSTTQGGSGILVHDHQHNVKTIRVYNLQKIRAKKKQSPRATYEGSGGQIRKTKIVESGHWVAYAYDFPVKLLQSMGVTVYQQKRNFVFKKDGKSYTVGQFKDTFK